MIKSYSIAASNNSSASTSVATIAIVSDGSVPSGHSDGSLEGGLFLGLAGYVSGTFSCPLAGTEKWPAPCACDAGLALCFQGAGERSTAPRRRGRFLIFFCRPWLFHREWLAAKTRKRAA